MVKLDKTTKILIWVTVMVIVLVAGGITAVILNNRFHTERDNALAEQGAQQKKAEQKEKQAKASSDNFGRSVCVSLANTSYWDYVKINATRTTTGADGQPVYYMPQSNWDFADKQKQESLNNCYKEYPAN